MNIEDKLNQAWTLLYDIRQERKAPYNEFNDDAISNILLHAMHDIKEALEELMDKKGASEGSFFNLKLLIYYKII